MRQNRVKILCQGFQWNPDLVKNDFEKMSFVANLLPAQVFTDEIDLMPYIKRGSLGEIEWNLEELAISEDGNSKEKYFLASDFSFDVINIKDNFNYRRFFNDNFILRNISMSQWFRIKEDTTYVKYRVKVKYNYGLNNWKTIWQGVVEQDFLEFQEGRGNDAQIIKVKCYGFEKQLKEYFEKLPLPLLSHGVALEQTSYQVRIGSEMKNISYKEVQNWFTHYQFDTMIGAFTYNTSLNSDLQPGYNNPPFKIMSNPHYARYGGINHYEKQVLYQGGYDFVEDETVWSFLQKLCNAMGWIFFFMEKSMPIGDNELTFCLRDRFSNNNTNIFQIDRKKITKQGINWTKSTPDVTVKCIIVKNGYWKGGFKTHNKGYYSDLINSFNFASDRFWGNRIIPIFQNDLFKDDNENKIASIHFNSCDMNSDSYIHFGYYTNGYAEEVNSDDNNYALRVYDKIEFVNEGNNYGYFKPREKTFKNLNKKDVLILSVGDFKKGTIVKPNGQEIDTYVDFPAEGLDWQACWFTGNYGSMIGLDVGINGKNYTYTYQDIVKTEQFKNNFLKFLDKHSNINCEFEYEEIICNPNQTFKLETEAGSNNFEKYSLSKMKINLEKETTTLTLIK